MQILSQFTVIKFAKCNEFCTCTRKFVCDMANWEVNRGFSALWKRNPWLCWEMRLIDLGETVELVWVSFIFSRLRKFCTTSCATVLWIDLSACHNLDFVKWIFLKFWLLERPVNSKSISATSAVHWLKISIKWSWANRIETDVQYMFEWRKKTEIVAPFVF